LGLFCGCRATKEQPNPVHKGDTTVPNDPVVAKINLTDIRRSELDHMLQGDAGGSVKKALQLLARQALLNQEAKVVGRGTHMPRDPGERAEFFLRRVASKRVICGNISERDLKQMYSAMKPRFVRGHLYHVAQLQWLCPGEGDPEQADCIRRAWQFARERWQGVVDAVKEASDLYWMGQLNAGADHLRYVEMTVHVALSGRANVPPEAAQSIQALSPGRAALSFDKRGARIQLLVGHRPPINRTLAERSVRAQVLAELCPRLVKRHREQYVSDLLKSAQIQVFDEHLPAISDWKKGD
jgi:hypothetical protein